MHPYITYSCLALQLLFFAALVPAHPTPDGRHDRLVSFTHNGHRRRFIVHAPAGIAGLRNLPLVLVLHGGGGTPRHMLGLTQRRFNDLADRDGAWVVYPEGLKKSWNDQRTDPVAFAHTQQIDDTGFIEAIIDKMQEKYHIDPARVFVTGISNGGFMSIRLGMELSGRIRAVAPVTAGIPHEGLEALEAMQKPVSLLLINGTEDPLVPYHGGPVTFLGKNRGAVISTAETIRLWRERTGCDQGPVTTRLPDTDPDDQTRAVRFDYTSSRDSTRTVLIEIQGGGHAWPGGPQYFRKRLIGRVSRDFDACEVIWEFFKDVSR